MFKYFFGLIISCFIISYSVCCWSFDMVGDDCSNPNMINQSMRDINQMMGIQHYDTPHIDFQTNHKIEVPNVDMIGDTNKMNHEMIDTAQHDVNRGVEYYDKAINSHHHNVIIYRDKYGNRRAVIMDTSQHDTVDLRDIN